ncbi:4-(cytidine 5'-diphospho)-2-C-methyl-D-erythritol kinase [Primorskyibacter sp. 2E233]|uniref:4-(cytidine 5'-diphospho)-2-C-methyl-D-erythritol kinase n=1 Tax=Primorskyibacter sp. 2E233 TaxID=3413431 RepID=UPI003BF0CFCC
MKTPIEAFAPAKINLTLHVTGQRADGYHLLDSLVVFADLGDRLTLTPGPKMSMGITGPFADGVPCDARNLAWRAAELADWTGHIALDKQLPHGAGIGGGSSDAGAVLRALGSNADALQLGADVPVCRLARASRMSGIGEELAPIEFGEEIGAILVNPGVHVPTPAMFKALESKQNPAMPDIPTQGGLGKLMHWLDQQRNDLQVPAISAQPVMGQVLSALDATNPYLSRMSGSGATCFALYESPESAKFHAAQLQDLHPAWWVRATLLR